MKSFELAIITPEGPIFEGLCIQVNMPGSEGDLGILSGHMSLMFTTKPGLVEIERENLEPIKMVVAGGIAEATPDRCTLLVEKGTDVKFINFEDIKQKMEYTKHQIGKATTDTMRKTLEMESGYLAALLTHGSI